MSTRKPSAVTKRADRCRPDAEQRDSGDKLSVTIAGKRARRQGELEFGSGNHSIPEATRSGPPEVEEARPCSKDRAELRERALHGAGGRLSARVVGGTVRPRASVDDDPSLLH